MNDEPRTVTDEGLATTQGEATVALLGSPFIIPPSSFFVCTGDEAFFNGFRLVFFTGERVHTENHQRISSCRSTKAANAVKCYNNVTDLRAALPRVLQKAKMPKRLNDVRECYSFSGETRVPAEPHSGSKSGLTFKATIFMAAKQLAKCLAALRISGISASNSGRT